MSDIDETNDISAPKRTKPLQKNKIPFLSNHEGFLHEDLDKNCLYTFSDTLVRIEYPGYVKNVDKAINSLGGIHEIQKSVEGKNKLELKFHPNNHYNKGCIADKDTSVGILLKLKQENNCKDYSYEIVGVTGVNFKFNRMCDFQYLPLLPKDTPENEESEVEYIHDRIFPKEIPTLEWFTQKEICEQPLFMTSSMFAKFDLPQGKFQTNSTDTFVSLVRPDFPKVQYSLQKKKEKSTIIHSFRINFLKSDLKIPDQPSSLAMEELKKKHLEEHVSVIVSLFEKRPIWRKISIIHKSKLNNESIKYILPCVAYYCQNGPWRACWLRLGYNPMSDFNSRIYQILDYRIRSNEGVQFKIRTKKGFLASFFKEKYQMENRVTEAEYVLRPNNIPPARQMFYQYCDILIPEIQDMLAKLPKLPPTTKYDPKNGWLPLSFTEHCREIVNKYVLEAVQKELTLETKTQNTVLKNDDKSDNIVSRYCSKMLSNIKKGNSGEPSRSIEEVDLISDDTEQIDADEVVNSLPERIFQFSDDEGSDMEIDIEAVEEINEMVLGNQDDLN